MEKNEVCIKRNSRHFKGLIFYGGVNKHETQRNELLDVSFNEVNLEKISTLGFEL